MKIKQSIMLVIAALTMVIVSGCAVQTARINKQQRWPGGSYSDRSSNGVVDVAMGGFHQETIQNDITSTNVGGYSTSDKSSATKTSVNVPFIGFICGLWNDLSVHLARGAEVLEANDDSDDSVILVEPTYRTQKHFYNRAVRIYGAGGHHGGSDHNGGGFNRSHGHWYSPTGNGSHGGGGGHGGNGGGHNGGRHGH